MGRFRNGSTQLPWIGFVQKFGTLMSGLIAKRSVSRYRAMLRVDVNGVPKIARHLGWDASRSQLTVELSQAELQCFAYLNLVVRASL